MSPLTQGRGLKHLEYNRVWDEFESPLTQGRGLKPMLTRSQAKAKVAPHAGAWIETAISSIGETIAVVAPHAGAWIETKLNPPKKDGV